MKPVTKRILWAAGVLVTMAIVGTVIGVVVVEVNKNKPPADAFNNSTDVATVTTSQTGLHAPTVTGDHTSPTAIPSITPNAALHKSFYGMAYTPAGAIMPDCGANIAAVRKDVGILSQLTTRLRLYGSDCNVTSLVLQAIQDMNVDLKVFPAIFLEPDDASYTRQKTALQSALSTYGTNNVLGIAVGNEYVLSQTNAGDTTENATARVVSKMNEVRTDLTALGYSLEVGTSDAGGTVTQNMVDNADFVFANVHPWFSQNTAATAATFANTFYTNTLTPLDTASTRNPPAVMYQGEYGWPSASDITGDTNEAGDTPSLANLQTVLNAWVCPAKTAGTRYFWFSAFDEPWKATNGGVEAHWGLFDKDGNLKQITIPNC